MLWKSVGVNDVDANRIAAVSWAIVELYECVAGIVIDGDKVSKGTKDLWLIITDLYNEILVSLTLRVDIIFTIYILLILENLGNID